MNREELIAQIKAKKSMLCVGLDTDMDKLPEGVERSMKGMVDFNRAIIQATHKFAVAYKINTAFYEQYGSEGWQCMEDTLNLIPKDCFTIADAKRGDIGNTSSMYARAFFKRLNFDSITVAPYMGKDSVEPFLAFENKHAILLALTSNEGAFDFQTKNVDGKELYKVVIETSKSWKNSENLMYVVGATKAEYFTEIRKIIPDSFLLVPGVGAQGGSLQEVCKYGMSKNVGLLINSSRGIIFASNGIDFAEKARAEALKMQLEMKTIINTNF